VEAELQKRHSRLLSTLEQLLEISAPDLSVAMGKAADLVAAALDAEEPLRKKRKSPKSAGTGGGWRTQHS
jgi:hypothetical protein